MNTDEMRLPRSQWTLADRRLAELAAAVRDHEAMQRARPYAVRETDLNLYRRLRQILGAPK